MDRYTSEFGSLGRHLNPGGDLLLYGCNLASGVEGRSLIARIADLTGRDVAASTDLTGRDGNWALEYTYGTVEKTILT
ncbi:MAG: DUF4347 domain-containing protein [Cyanobacteriota bacterium]